MSMPEQEFFTIRDTMDAFKVYIPFIEQNGLNSAVLSKIIDEHKPVKEQLKVLRDRYEVSKEGVPIMQRTIMRSNDVASAVNNKLNNAYDSDIVDTKIGYFLGNPINYTVEKEKVTNADVLIEEMDKMRVRDNLPDKDATLGKRASIGGYGARLCYIAIENDKPVPRITNLRPEEVIFFYKETMSEPTYSLHYYDTVRVNAAGEKIDVTVADFYDTTMLYRWVKTDGEFVLEEQKITGFLINPLFGMENNDELSGEAQKVIGLINAFDRTLSDASNEIESSRLAILVLSNLNLLNDEDVDALKQAGVLEIQGEENGEIKYLTKDVNDTIIQNHLEWLNKQILRFTKSVDFTDETFSSNLSGVAILFKTMALEHKTSITENKMRSTLQYQMKVLCSAWSLLGVCEPDDYLKVWFSFKRNLPHNVEDAAKATNLLKGMVAEDTRLSLLPFIDDVKAEKEAMERDKQAVEATLGALNVPSDNTNT